MGSIGNIAAYPNTGDKHHNQFPELGMTYRQWLIGKALTGVIAQRVPSPSQAATDAIDAADSVISWLDKEE